MSDSYVVLWTNDRCKWLKKNGESGKTLQTLFGGPHQSAPMFSKFGVKPGDYIYPIYVAKVVVFIIARMKVRNFASLNEFLAQYLHLTESDVNLHLFDLENKLRSERPGLGHLIPYSCVDEVAIGDEGTPIRFDRQVPWSTLEQLRFRSRQGERGL